MRILSVRGLSGVVACGVALGFGVLGCGPQSAQVGAAPAAQNNGGADGASAGTGGSSGSTAGGAAGTGVGGDGSAVGGTDGGGIGGQTSVAGSSDGNAGTTDAPTCPPAGYTNGALLVGATFDGAHGCVGDSVPLPVCGCFGTTGHGFSDYCLVSPSGDAYFTQNNDLCMFAAPPGWTTVAITPSPTGTLPPSCAAMLASLVPNGTPTASTPPACGTGGSGGTAGGAGSAGSSATGGTADCVTDDSDAALIALTNCENDPNVASCSVGITDLCGQSDNACVVKVTDICHDGTKGGDYYIECACDGNVSTCVLQGQSLSGSCMP